MKEFGKEKKKHEKEEKKLKIEEKVQEVKKEQNQEKKEELKKQEVPSAPKFEKDEKFKLHYDILSSMGFKDVEVCSNLLNKHKGNIQKVVDEYLNTNK